MARAKKKRKRTEPDSEQTTGAEPTQAEGLALPEGVAPWVPAPAAPYSGALIAAGVLVLAAGVAAVLYPAMLTREAFIALVATQGWAPFAGFFAVLLGGALAVFGVHRASGAARPWPREALPTEGFVARLPWGLRHIAHELTIPAVLSTFDAEARADRTLEKRYDWGPALVLCFGAVFLAFMEYWGHAPEMRRLLDSFDPVPRDASASADGFFARVRDSSFASLLEFAWWSGWRVLGFFLLPAFVIRVLMRRRVVDHGLQTGGFRSHAWIYGLSYLFVLVLVAVVSQWSSFSEYYPFYRYAGRSWYDFFAWEMLYAFQFFSLEFFFRGFWLNGARRSLGSAAIYAMVVPYVMIHFGKPMAETLVAILAGLALGALSLRTRSIWGGFLIHVGVAITMDVAVLAQGVGMPSQLYPSW